MSEVTATFVVQPIEATINVDNNNINITPTVTDINIFTGATSYSITQLDADISNVHISGGVNGYVLETDGLGNLSWTAQTSGTGTGIPGGSNTQVQFNDAGSFGGNAGFTFDKTTGNVTAANFVGNLSGTATTASYSWHAFVADTANAVAVGNVVGIGNISVINLDGNAGNVIHGDGSWSSALSLSGDGGNLSNINGANVSGAVGLATYATTANAVAGANVSGYVANATHANIADSANAVAGANVSGQVANALVAGTVYTNAQPNITSLGTLVSLSVTGNSNTGNIYTGGIGGNISGANVISANLFIGNITGNVSGNVANANTITANTFTGNLNGNVTGGNITSNATVNFTTASNVSLGAVGNVKITGGTANYILKTDGTGNLAWIAQPSSNSSSISNGTSNVNIATSNGNVTVTANGTTSLTVSNANVTARQFISNVATGTAPFVVTSNTTVANLTAFNAINAATVYSLTTDSVVGSLTANTYIVPLSNASASLGFTGQRFSNLFVGNIYFSGNLFGNATTAPATAVSTTISNKLPIVINGVTYYICLTAAV